MAVIRAAEHMHVSMVDRLSRRSPDVDSDPDPVLGKPLAQVSLHLTHHQPDLLKHRWRQGEEVRLAPPRHNEDVAGVLRMSIEYHGCMGTFEHRFSGSDAPAERALVAGCH